LPAAAPGPAHAAGLSVSEVVALKVSDIDFERLLLRIEQGNGRKVRFAKLSPRLLDLLRDWYRIARPTVWLFPGRNPMLPMTTRQFNRAVHAAAGMAGIKKPVTPHTLRTVLPPTCSSRYRCSPSGVSAPSSFSRLKPG
jgi:integrase